MGKFALNNLPKEKRIQMIAEFYDVIASLKNREEVRLFFRDLLSPDEIAMLMRRIEVMAMLLAGFTYDEISRVLGVGKSKINSVQKTLSRHGEGYRIAIRSLLKLRKKKIKRQKRQERDRVSVFADFKKKYPLYFLLFNLIDEIGEYLEEGITDKEASIKTPSRNF